MGCHADISLSFAGLILMMMMEDDDELAVLSLELRGDWSVVNLLLV